MKFCKDCKHLEGDVCFAEKLHGLDPVTGRRKGLSASICRDSYARCGPEGTAFELREIKPGLIQKAIFYFKKGLNGDAI